MAKIRCNWHIVMIMIDFRKSRKFWFAYILWKWFSILVNIFRQIKSSLFIRGQNPSQLVTNFSCAFELHFKGCKTLCNPLQSNYSVEALIIYTNQVGKLGFFFSWLPILRSFCAPPWKKRQQWRESQIQLLSHSSSWRHPGCTDSFDVSCKVTILLRTGHLNWSGMPVCVIFFLHYWFRLHLMMTEEHGGK